MIKHLFYQGLYRDVKTSSDKELKFRMRFNQSQILVVQYVNSRQHTGKWRLSYTAVMASVALWSSRKLVQWNVIVLYPFCVRATLHVPVKSLPPNPSAIHNSLYCNNMKSSQWGQKGQAQNNSVIFVQVTKCYIDKTLVSLSRLCHEAASRQSRVYQSIVTTLSWGVT